MPGIRETLKTLKAFRKRFSQLFAEERRKQRQPFGGGPGRRLQALTPEGANPGNLLMHVYVPDHLPSDPGLVVALHGCGQTAADYDLGTGWSQIADRYGFVVLFPEQQPANNPKRCFSWFQLQDIGRDLGEARSIHEMVEHAIVKFGIDRRKVFITGLSAGGAMAAVMLAAYPEVYAGGAVIAGLPYGCAGSVQEAFEAMFTDQHPSPRALGDRVRAASRHRGPWPRVSVWQGTADKIVKPSNAENLIKQWSNVHGLGTEPTRLEPLGRHTRHVWEDVDGNVRLEAISIAGMGHGVALGPVSGPDGCGTPGPFFLDVGLSSTIRIAGFFGFDAGDAADTGTYKRAIESDWVGDRESEDWSHAGNNANAEAREMHENKYQAGSFDPGSVIAAAFKAAGLPTPDGRGGVDPNAIIEATLKATGLWRR